MLKITQIVSSVEAEAAGPSYSVPRLGRALAALGYQVHLMTLGQPRTTQDGGVRHTRFEGNLEWAGPLARLGMSETMRRALLDQQADVYHSHGLWMMPNVYPAAAACKWGKPLMLAPRGMLGASALRFSSRTKKAFWALVQRRAVGNVTCFHATSDLEYQDIRAFGLRQPVAVIPNGIDLPVFDAYARTEPTTTPVVLSMGRIHPKKALDRLIKAWAEVESLFPDWQLRIVGPSEVCYAEELERLAHRLETKRVFIEGPIFGDEKWALLRSSEIFALSTLHENFGMTVAESLAAGTPVISTKGAPWRGLEEHGCGWWIDPGTQPLAAALRQAMAFSPTARAEMGARGRAWMERDFGWNAIAQRMADVYNWLSGNSDPPPTLRFD